MAFSVLFWTSFVKDSTKLQRKSEFAVKEGRVLSFAFDSDTRCVRSQVQASMRDRSYRVSVSVLARTYVK